MKKCRKGVMWKDSVARYVNNGLVSVLKLKDSIESGQYKIDDYHEFIINEPKRREIVSTKFKDRVFQRSLCDNYTYDAITRQFIYDNGACQIGKGTDFARDRLECLLQRHFRQYGNTGHILSCDFKNFFGSTSHAIAKDVIVDCVNNEWVLEHIYNIIDSFNQGEDAEVGLGLGSQVTQLVQLAVLNKLDHMVKEDFKIKGYLRYMDDMILIHPSKQHLNDCLVKIKKYVETLGLTLNKKKTQIIKINQGVKFLGFKFILNDTGQVIKYITKENVKKRKRKLRKYKKLVEDGKMTKEKADECYKSWKAHAEKGNSYKLLRSMDKYYEGLWKE